MGRWTQYDTDEYRLPPNFQRIAYDADEGVYTYRDTSDNSLWKGAPGNEFGELVRVSGPSSSAPTTGLDVEEVFYIIACSLLLLTKYYNYRDHRTIPLGTSTPIDSSFHSYSSLASSCYSYTNTYFCLPSPLPLTVTKASVCIRSSREIHAGVLGSTLLRLLQWIVPGYRLDRTSACHYHYRRLCGSRI